MKIYLENKTLNLEEFLETFEIKNNFTSFTDVVFNKFNELYFVAVVRKSNFDDGESSE